MLNSLLYLLFSSIITYQKIKEMFQLEKYGQRMGQFQPSFKTLKCLQTSQRSVSQLPPTDINGQQPKLYQNQIRSLSPDYQLKTELSTYIYFLQRCGDFMDQNFQTIKTRSNFLLCWNLLNFLAIFLCFIQTLFIIFIISKIEGNWDQSFAKFSYILAIIMLFDMLFVRHRVLISQDGNFNRARSQLLDRYLRKFFIWDLLTLIILFIDSLTINHFPYIRLLVFMKGFILRQINGQISIGFLGHPTLAFFYRLIRIIFFSFFFTFLYGNIYTFLDIYYYQQKGEYYQNRMLWISGSTKFHMVNYYESFAWYAWFEIGVYMVLQMVRGCGYGTPSPRSPPSQLFYSLAALTMMALFAYYAKVFMDMLIIPSQHQAQLIRSYVSLLEVASHPSNLPIHHKNVSFTLVDILAKNKKILNFLQMMEQRLSNKLLQDFNSGYKKYFTYRLSFIAQLISGHDQKHFRFQISQKIKVKSIYSSMVLYRPYDLVSQEIYVSGQAQIVQSREEIEYEQFLQKWAVFGIRQCFIDKKSLINIQVKSTGIIKYIQKAAFLQVLKKYAQIYESFFLKMQGIRLGQTSTQAIEVNCCLCGKYHLSERCNYLRNKQCQNLDKAPFQVNSLTKLFLLPWKKIHPELSKIQSQIQQKSPCKLPQMLILTNKRLMFLRKARQREKIRVKTRNIVYFREVLIDEYYPTFKDQTNFNL